MTLSADLAIEAGTDLPLARGGAQIARFLDDHGYRHVFAIPGSSMAGAIHALQNCKADYVPSIHESVTIAMADGYARVAGSAVAMLYMQPGMLNGMANLYNAFADETPLIVLASQQTSTIRTPGWTVCEGDIAGTARPYTRFAHEVLPGMELRTWLERARRTSLGPVAGPVMLSLPEDVIDEPQPTGTVRVSTRPTMAAPDVTAIADALRHAKRPLIVVGGQLGRMGGARAIEALSLDQSIPMVYEYNFNSRLGAAPGHPNMFGNIVAMPSLEQDADAVLVIGARYMFDSHPRPVWFPAARFIAHVNADPSKLELTRSADWAAAADPALVAAALRDALAAEPASPELRAARDEWMRSVRGLGRQGLWHAMGHYLDAVAPLYDTLDHGWLVDESTLGIFALQQTLSATDGSRYFATSGASLGWGTGAAAGVALASGEPVTLTIGDGSLRFSALGLWTIAARNLPITIVVLDNGGYGSTRMFERLYVEKLGPEAVPQRPGYLGSDLRDVGPSVHSIIEGFGIPCHTVEPGEDARAAIETAWSKRGDGPNAVVLPVPFAG